jgi:solute carrier family 29 (equilibrative nucleoside transporter), member 1/2/3
MSTFIRTSPGFFFAFVLLDGTAQTALGSYLQTAVIAIASQFGPTAVQAMMSGQAAVAVIVSSVQVLSAFTSTFGENRVPSLQGQQAEEKAALAFFGLSTIFLVFTIFVQRRLSSLPAYKTLVGSLEVDQPVITSLSDSHEGMILQPRSKLLQDIQNVLRVAKVNVIFEFAVAYVFIVTLVCLVLLWCSCFHRTHRLSSLLSRYLFLRQIHMCTPYFSAQLIF